MGYYHLKTSFDDKFNTYFTPDSLLISVPKTLFSRFSKNPEAIASELLDNLEEI